MEHKIFQENSTYDIAVLIKSSSLNKDEILKNYITPSGLPENKFIAFDLEYNSNDKCPVKLIKAYLDSLLNALDKLSVKTLYVCDSSYFKTLTNSRKANPHYGYVLDCAIKGYEHFKVILGMNYKALMYNPQMQSKLDLSLTTLVNQMRGVHVDLGTNIIHSAAYPESFHDIAKALDSLHQYDTLTVDIETFSLRFDKAGIGTIAFAWNKNEGIAFNCDYKPIKKLDPKSPTESMFGTQVDNPRIKTLLYQFFTTYKGTLIYQNANFDIKILIYELFMEGLLDQQGLLDGLAAMTQRIQDTKIITYLAVNSTAGNKLGLKEQAHEFAGNYANDDIKDIRFIPNAELLEYNLIDCLSTWYVCEKNLPIMLLDKQKDVYDSIFLPSVKPILQMELTGIPLDMPRVLQVENILKQDQQKHFANLMTSNIIIKFQGQLRKEAWIEKNLLLKKKVKPLSDFDDIHFNPSSNTQIQKLIYEVMGYDIIDKTDGGLPAVGAKTLKKVSYNSKSKEHSLIFDSLIGLGQVNIILNTFIKSFINKSILKADGIWYLHGNFNIGGTVSGRLSSSKPNLQNIPSTGNIYAKLIKECFAAPPGWLMVGADYWSLEDRISALTTQDPNKLKVYIDGYDGHCLRAYSYFGEHMPDIEMTVDSINSIKVKYPDFRQDSKAPTFALTYQGTWHTLVNNIGLSEIDSKAIEKNYHNMYKVADEWVEDKLNQASIDGYITVAFGLRVRTPILGQTLRGKKSTPYEAKAEGRTAGNALGQSYGLLNNRAAIEFQKRTLVSKYALQIKPTAQIHDSMYFLIKDNLGCIKWFNDNLPDCMAWQNLPEIKHPIVKLGGNVEIYHPNWSNHYSLENSISKKEIIQTIKEQQP